MNNFMARKKLECRVSWPNIYFRLFIFLVEEITVF